MIYINISQSFISYSIRRLGIYIILTFIMCLLQNWGIITRCVILELCLRECYKSMTLEAISDDDWLLTDVERYNVLFVI